MERTSQLIALLAFLALLPFAVYAVVGTELSLFVAAVGAFNIVLIGGALFLLFGPGEDASSTANAT